MEDYSKNYTVLGGLNSSDADISYQPLLESKISEPYPEQFYYVLVGLVGSVTCCIGLLGNILNTTIFGMMLRHGATAPATNVFLLTISAIDFMILLIYLVYDTVCITTPPRPMLDVNSFTIDQIGTFGYYTYFSWYLPTNILVLTSNWLTVSVMVFRFIAVYFPMRAFRWCAANRAKIVLPVVFILAVASVVPECFTIQLVYVEGFGYLFSDTNLFGDENFHATYYMYLFMINSVIPFVVCLLLSSLLIRALRRSDISFRKEGTARHLPKRRKEQRRISLMLLGVVFCYLICTIPALLWRIMKPFVLDGIITYSLWQKLRAVADILLIVQHSINFIIYLLSNQVYRRYLRYIIFHHLKMTQNRSSHQTITTRSFRQRCGTATSLNRSQLKPKIEELPQVEISEGGVKSDNLKVTSDVMEHQPLIVNKAKDSCNK